MSEEDQRRLIESLREPMLRVAKPAIDEFCSRILTPYRSLVSTPRTDLVDSCVDYSIVLRDALQTCGISTDVRSVEYLIGDVQGQKLWEEGHRTINLPPLAGHVQKFGAVYKLWRCVDLNDEELFEEEWDESKAVEGGHVIVVTGPDEEILDMSLTQLVTFDFEGPTRLDQLQPDCPRHFWSNPPPPFILSWEFTSLDMSRWSYFDPTWKPVWHDLASTLASCFERIIQGEEPDITKAVLNVAIPEGHRHPNPWGHLNLGAE